VERDCDGVGSVAACLRERRGGVVKAGSVRGDRPVELGELDERVGLRLSACAEGSGEPHGVGRGEVAAAQRQDVWDGEACA